MLYSFWGCFTITSKGHREASKEICYLSWEIGEAQGQKSVTIHPFGRYVTLAIEHLSLVFVYLTLVKVWRSVMETRLYSQRDVLSGVCIRTCLLAKMGYSIYKCPHTLFGWIFLKGDPKVVSVRLIIKTVGIIDLLDCSDFWGVRENLQISEGVLCQHFEIFFSLEVKILLTLSVGGGGGDVDIKWNVERHLWKCPM